MNDNYQNSVFSEEFIVDEIKKFDKWFVHTDLGNNIVAKSTAWPDAPSYSTHMGVAKFDYIVKPNLPSLMGKRVLELGCNNGLNSIHMCRLGAREVIAIDSTKYWPMVIEQANFVKHALEWRCGHTYNVSYYDADMGDLPDLDFGKFDVVIALNCLYYLDETKISEVTRHISELADTFLIQCNTRDQKHLGNVPTPEYMSKMLQDNNFKHTFSDLRWDSPRWGIVPKRYSRPVVVGTNDSNFKPLNRLYV